MYVTLDSRHKLAYIGLTAQPDVQVAESIALYEWADDAAVDAMHHLVLDFDGSGRLVGIEVPGRAHQVLPADLLAEAKRI